MAPDADADRAELLALATDVFGEGAWTGEYPARSLSSVELMRFVLRLERRFEIIVSDEELRAENFASMTATVALIHRSRARGN